MAKKYGYEAYLEDQKKRKEEEKKGQVRYVEAAQASRIQYSLPQYQGKSQNQGKTYQWERDLMANTRIKGAGNSYTKKFDALTKRMGMTEGQASEFRKYLDFQEDSQHVDPKLNKDGTIKQNQSLKYARDAKLKSDVIDGILKNMHKTGAQRVKDAQKKQVQFAEDTKKANKNSTKERDGFLGLLDSTLGRLGENATKVFGEKFANDVNENYRINNAEELKKDPTDKRALEQLQMLNTVDRKAENGVEKTSDFVGRALGEIAPYTIGGAYGAADAILGKLGLNAAKSPLVREAVRGATAGGVVGTGKSLVRDNTSNPEDFGTEDYLKTIGLESALGGAGDAAIGALARNLNLKGLTKGLSDDVTNQYTRNLAGGRTPEQMELALREEIVPKNVLADPVKQDPQHILEQLTDTFTKKPSLKINNWQDNAYKKPPVDEQAVADDYLMDAHTRRQAAEDDFIQQELAPHMETQQRAAQAQETWENVVKQAKTEIDRIKGNYGKIHVPKGAAEDYPIPPQFRATYGDKSADDIYSFADQEGFSSPDEAIAYLRQLDADSKTRLKDLMPADHKPFSEDDWANLERAARQKFPQTEQGKALDRLITDLIEGNTTSTPLRTIDNAPTPGLPTPGLPGNVDEILKAFKENPQIVNNSQAPEQVLEQLVRPKDATEAVNPAPVSEELAAGVQPETSSNMKPLGISAGQPKANDISWVEDPQGLVDRVKSGKENAGTVKRKLKTEIISDLQPVKDVEREIASMDVDGQLRTILGDKTNVSAEDSLFKGLRGVRRSISEAMKTAKDDYGSILKTLRTNKISKRDFDEYVSAVHFNDVLKNNHDLMVKAGEVDEQLALNEQLAQGTTDKETLKALAEGEKELLQMKKDLEPYKLPASATEEAVERVLKRWENTPAMKDAQKAFMDAQNRDLDLLVESGVYSQGTADAMRSAHPNYIYMGRAKEEANVLGAGGNSSKPNKHIIKRANGSEENLKYSPLESAVRNRLLTYSNARRNVAMQQIEKLAGVHGASKYFTKLNPHTASTSQMRNSVKFFEDGVEQRYEVPPALKDAFENIDAKNAQDLVSSSLRAVANVTRKGATYFNTDFIFSSVFRDANGLITSRTNMHPGELILGYMDSFMGKGLERMSGGKFKSYKGLYEKMGGHQTGFVTLDPQSTKQFMKDMDRGTLGKGIKIINPRNWPEVITKFGGAIEHGPKLGEFRSAKNKGLGDADAMHEATEVIDYTDQGSTIRNWNDKIPFLNPAIRGNTRYFQAAKENFPAWMGKNLLYVTTPTVGIYMMRFSPTTSEGQRSKLRNMSEYQKNMFWHIPVPNSETILSIPKMHTAAQLFGNPIERALDLAFEDNPKSVSRILKDTGADSLNVLVPPSAVAGVTQLKNAIANYDPLMDMPIEDMAMQKNPDKTEHYNSFTSEVAKGLGKTFNQSPAKIDYLLKSLTGGTGRDILDVTDNALAKTGLVDRPQKVDTILDIINPVRRYQYKDTSGLETSSELYDQQKRDTFNGNKDSDAVRLYSDMKALNKEIKGIRESKDMSSQEKKEAIAALREQQRAIGDEAIQLGILRNR